MYEVEVPLLFQLPNAWLIALLSEWLDIPSIGKLDTAISVETYRRQFLLSLGIMRSTTIDSFSDGRGRGETCLRGSRTGEWTGYWWRWLSIRQIYIERITLRTSEVRSNFIIPSLQKVISISLDDDDLHYLVHNSPALRSLSLEAQVFDTGRLMSQNGLQVLTNLHLTLEELTVDWHFYVGVYREDYSQTAAALIDVFRHCSKLKKVSLNGNTLQFLILEDLLPFAHLFYELRFYRERTYQAIPELLRRCINLRKFDYCGREYDEYVADDGVFDQSVLTAVSHWCPLLEDLVVWLSRMNFVIPDTVFMGLRNNCKHLRKLVLSLCNLSGSSMYCLAGVDSLEVLVIELCDGLTNAGIAELAKLRLVVLQLAPINDSGKVTEAALVSFAGASISHTLETLVFSVGRHRSSIDDVAVAIALATCHRLKQLHIPHIVGENSCFFGRNGMDGLQAMAVGCPLLADIELAVTIRGIHHIAGHFRNLKKCAWTCPDAVSSDMLSVLESRSPGVDWRYRANYNTDEDRDDGGDDG